VRTRQTPPTRKARILLVLCVVCTATISLAVDGDRQTNSTAVVVVIDAGHGGKDPGAIGAGGVYEKDITLSIARSVAREAANYPELCIVLTRVDDRFLELKDRLAVAKRAGAVAYVSIHLNAATDTAARGVETYPSGGARFSKDSLELAQALQTAAVSATLSSDRGVRHDSFYIDRAAMPAALLEVGFVTQKNEAKVLQDPVVQQKIARAILKSVSQYVAGR
jgi:N-acetylmuramoyl-L-alanine amidase